MTVQKHHKTKSNVNELPLKFISGVSRAKDKMGNVKKGRTDKVFFLVREKCLWYLLHEFASSSVSIFKSDTRFFAVVYSTLCYVVFLILILK